MEDQLILLSLAGVRLVADDMLLYLGKWHDERIAQLHDDGLGIPLGGLYAVSSLPSQHKRTGLRTMRIQNVDQPWNRAGNAAGSSRALCTVHERL
jgi:hypothetical protein